jgi:hypothetical protein
VNRTRLVALALLGLLATTIMCTIPNPPANESRSISNEACLECHKSFRDDSLSKTHRRAGERCVDCHGPSEEHLSGRQPQAKPDVTFTRANVKPFCGRCHDPATHPDQAAKRFIEQWKGRKRPNGRSISPQSICTDCHGTHVLPRHAK